MRGPPPELRGGGHLNNRASGEHGEEIAARYLAHKGHEVLARNYRTRRGELDLITRHGGTLVFVEVKLRRSTVYGDPLEAVTQRKRGKIRRMAEEYLAKNEPSFEEVRFDVVGILLRDFRAHVTHVEDAF